MWEYCVTKPEVNKSKMAASLLLAILNLCINFGLVAQYSHKLAWIAAPQKYRYVAVDNLYGSGDTSADTNIGSLEAAIMEFSSSGLVEEYFYELQWIAGPL